MNEIKIGPKTNFVVSGLKLKMVAKIMSSKRILFNNHETLNSIYIRLEKARSLYKEEMTDHFVHRKINLRGVRGNEKVPTFY